ncbi:MAG: MFS transporter [Pirellulales bacterium]|nr:MFS transporter [Pirellulales bacterium]
MDTVLYLRLSALMFMEYAVWGAWMPVLAARLLGPMKLSGKQTGWVYATLPLASMISPLIAGHIADKWVNMEWILAGAHLLGAIFLFAAAKQDRFSGMFVVMLIYSFFYAATIPLVNALMFRHLTNADSQSPYIFLWAPVAWALVGYFLTGLRQLAKTGKDGRDCLYLATLLSVVMAGVCLLQPKTPPEASAGQPLVEVLGMLKDPNYLVFVIVSLCVAGMMQFYFLGSAQFMQDQGISSKNVPAIMAIAQAVQTAATLFALGYLLGNVGPKWTFTLGAASWLVLFIVYFIGRPRWLIVISQSFHGLAYVFFIIAGQIYAKNSAPSEITGSAQALIIWVQAGLGLFLGTQLAGYVMGASQVEGRFQWNKVWRVPIGILLAGVLVLALVFHGPPAKETPKQLEPGKDVSLPATGG